MTRAQKILALLEGTMWKAWLNYKTGKGIKFSLYDDHKNHDPREDGNGKVLTITPIMKEGYARIVWNGHEVDVNTYHDINSQMVQAVKKYLLSEYVPGNAKVIWEVSDGNRTKTYPTLKTMGAKFQSRVAAFR